MSEAILVALITGGFGVMIAFVQVLRRENKSDHGFVVHTLDRIEGKLDNHIDGHAKGDFD